MAHGAGVSDTGHGMLGKAQRDMHVVLFGIMAIGYVNSKRHVGSTRWLVNIMAGW